MARRDGEVSLTTLLVQLGITLGVSISSTWGQLRGDLHA